MSGKFDDVPVEDDTTVRVSRETTLGDRDVLYQAWTWEGVNGESLIFVIADVESVSDSDLEAEVRDSLFVNDGSQMTIERSESGYVFVNFNFEAVKS